MTGSTNRTSGYKGAVAALLFCLSCSTSFASNAVRSECDDISDLPTAGSSSVSSLTIRLTDHGLTDSDADMKDPASDPSVEKVKSPPLADAVGKKLEKETDETTAEADVTVAVDKLPETSLRLPGVADKDLPRFRRQMYRTDI